MAGKLCVCVCTLTSHGVRETKLLIEEIMWFMP